MQCWENDQYSRCKCLEVVDTPASVSDTDLEQKMCHIFQKIGLEIGGKIKDRDKAKGTGGTTVKFPKRKAFKVEKQLNSISSSVLDLSQDTKIFINESFCPYYRGIWNKFKQVTTNMTGPMENLPMVCITVEHKSSCDTK